PSVMSRDEMQNQVALGMIDNRRISVGFAQRTEFVSITPACARIESALPALRPRLPVSGLGRVADGLLPADTILATVMTTSRMRDGVRNLRKRKRESLQQPYSL